MQVLYKNMFWVFIRIKAILMNDETDSHGETGRIIPKLEQVDGASSHMPAPWHISVHIKIPNAFLQSSFIGLLPVTVSGF